MEIDFKNLNDLYLIGEIGINHNGDIKIAKKLIDAVNACKWDCAKFQKRSPDICVPDHQKDILRETPWGTMKYIDYKKRIEFEEKEYNQIDEYCKQKPLHWSASVWDFASLEFLLNYEVPFIKIPSAMMTNSELVKESAKSGKPIIMSTGMSTLKEVDNAVNNLMKNTDNFVIMHTNSSYPTPVEELNLRLIPYYQNRYNCQVGYSGHEYDLEPTVLAVTLGAKVIERHITISQEMWGTDQKSSLTVHAMNMLRRRISQVDKMLGSDNKEVTKSEEPIRRKLRGT